MYVCHKFTNPPAHPPAAAIAVAFPPFPSTHTKNLADPAENRERMSPFSSQASRGLAPAAGNGLVLSSQGAGRRLDGGLLSVAEVAAAIFQTEKWEGTVWSVFTLRGRARQNFVSLFGPRLPLVSAGSCPRLVVRQVVMQ